MLLTRRQWIAATALSGAAAAAPVPFVKSICSVIFPPGEPLESMFSRARQAGFAGIELRLGPDVPMESPDAALGRVRSLSRDSGVAIASLWVSEPLSRHPLNSPEAGIRQQGVADIRRATEIAAAVGCGALLLVPGRVGSGPRLFAGYEETWKRITDELGKCISAAAANKTLLTVENVWNKFLVSPLEMRAFVDQFHSPWLAAHFDMGNVMQFGYPEDWVHTLGTRIRRVHVKDYKLSSRAEQGKFVPLLEGDVNFAAVFRALREAGYSGFLSPEIEYDPARRDQLAEVAAKLDRILTM